MPKLTFAFCTYNRADRLEKLVAAMRAQTCPVPFEILAINNNSTDGTAELLTKLAQSPGPKLRWVTESKQGIVPARNRAIEEALESDALVFIDDDEAPLPGLLQAVSHAIDEEGADCVGGPIKIDFEPYGRPKWLDRELSGFLGEIDHGSTAFWIQDDSTPVWSGNVAYRMEIFRERPDLRFDLRYNREGIGIGGGSDAIMFRALLNANYRIRYRPDMAITHLVDEWKLNRGYFLKLHYRAGLRQGQFRMTEFQKTLFGIPPFLVSQFFSHCLKTLGLTLTGKPGQVRQAMNASNAIGLIVGYRRRAHSNLNS
jgi:glycosyltransferase involved in cell wall biosynthesis